MTRMLAPKFVCMPIAELCLDRYRMATPSVATQAGQPLMNTIAGAGGRSEARTIATARSMRSSGKAAGCTCTSALVRDEPPRRWAAEPLPSTRWRPIAFAASTR
jgi:hypothetical protein